MTCQGVWGISFEVVTLAAKDVSREDSASEIVPDRGLSVARETASWDEGFKVVLAVRWRSRYDGSQVPVPEDKPMSFKMARNEQTPSCQWQVHKSCLLDFEGNKSSVRGRSPSCV